MKRVLSYFLSLLHWLTILLVFSWTGLQAKELLLENWTFQSDSQEKKRPILVGKPLSKQGFPFPIQGTYIIDLAIPIDTHYESLGLFIGKIQSADEVYFNGTLIGKTGRISPYSPNWFRSRLYKIPGKLLKPGTNNHISIRIACHERGFECGVFREIPQIGNYETLFQKILWQDVHCLFILTLFLGIFLHQIISFIIRRETKASIYLALASISFILWQLPIVDYFHELEHTEVTFLISMFFVAQTLVPVFILLFIYAILQETLHIPVVLVLSIQVVICFLHLIPYLYEQRIYLIYIWELSCLLSVLAFFYAFYRHINAQTSVETKLLTLGILAICVLGIIDIYIDNISGKNMYISRYGFLIFNFLGSVSLSIQNRRTYLQLESLNNNLEKIVSERTQELEGKNKILEKELHLASVIQNRIHSRKKTYTQDIGILAKYIPMQKIGGDYYDWHYTSKDKVVLVVCDVVGHGIAAALIASTLKVSFVEHSKKTDDPFDILQGLNRQLIEILEHAYVSAFCVSFDLKAKKLQYSIAGHPHPLYIPKNNQEVTFLEGKGQIMGWLNPVRLRIYERELLPGDRFLFYTDGLFEAQNAEKEMFGETSLIPFLQANREKSLSDLQNSLLAELEAFQAGAFADDITFVLVEYTGTS
ncbi:MAG: SpoIIE family protein phosphatase [Spirochaetota bacterium]